MKSESGKTPLGWIITIVVVLLIAGASVAMIFGGTDIASDIKALIQNTNENTDETVQTQE